MEKQYLALVILSMALVTYLPRVLPLVLLTRRSLPPWLTSWLSYVPVAVISALLAPALLNGGSAIPLPGGNTYLLAAVPTFLVAILTKSLFGSVVTGMISLVLVNRLLLF